jgi:hypothetical protein
MTEPFYMPDPALFGHSDAFAAYTRYAAELDEAGLRDEFPIDSELRKIAIELLTERYSVEMVQEDRSLITESVDEAKIILRQMREKGFTTDS